MRWSAVFKRRELWSIGIYKIESIQDIFGLDSHEPEHIIGETGIRKDCSYQSTVADPFLFSYGGRLHVFYEVKTDHGHGEIWGKCLDNNSDWISLGKILSENFHLSYPQVFEHNDKIYMIPETTRSGHVIAYETSNFPYGWKKQMILIEEVLADPTITYRQGSGFFIFGTARNGKLKLFSFPEIDSAIKDRGKVITGDKRYSRCGGAILDINGVSYRIAQDCSEYYGKRLNFQEIKEISNVKYVEKSTSLKIFDENPNWASIGYHHLSVAKFNSDIYVAIDGRAKDRFINTLMLAIMRLKNMFHHKT